MLMIIRGMGWLRIKVRDWILIAVGADAVVALLPVLPDINTFLNVASQLQFYTQATPPKNTALPTLTPPIPTSGTFSESPPPTLSSTDDLSAPVPPAI